MNIGFIGCGQIGKMLLNAVIKSDVPDKVFVTTKTKKSGQILAENYPIILCETNQKLFEISDIVLLCVKPSDLDHVFNEIQNINPANKIIITITSDIAIEKRLKDGAKIIKTLPNTAIETGEGIILYSPGINVSENDIETFKSILKFSGSFILLNDQMLKIAGKITGCGPAFLYTIIDAIIDSGIMLGLDKDLARDLTLKMIIGAVQKAMSTNRPMEDLKREVTTPGGRSIEGIFSLEKNGFRGILMEAFMATFNKQLPNE